MEKIFGIPMSTLVIVLVALLSLCLLSVAWVAWRKPVIFKLGMRNIPRRKAQTILIVVGLMLSTMIMSAALGVGDTVNYSRTSIVYDSLDHVDEVVVASQTSKADLGTGESKMPRSAYATVQQAVAGNRNVDGVMAELREVVPVVNTSKQLSEPTVNLVGIDPAQVDAFGGITATNGDRIDLASLPAGSVVVENKAARKLDVAAGDTLTVYVANKPIALTVAAIAKSSYITGGGANFRGDGDSLGLVMPLAQAQAVLGLPDTITAVLISNAGGVRGAVDHSDAVVDSLAESLTGTQLGVIPFKKDLVDFTELTSQVFTGLFLVLGLFSIAAGILLIVLIFTMLAAERRAEMGMARAVGTHRRQLIQQFVAEGSGYAILAGFVGAALGVLAAIGIGFGMGYLFGGGLEITPHVTVRSLIAAYSLGVVITFFAVVGSSWKISRLNIVAAIRDIPDVTNAHRKKRSLIWAGLLLLAGTGLTLTGVNSGSAFPFYAGMSLLPFGIAIVLRFFGVPSRPIFSLIGIYLIVFWLLPEKQFEAIFGTYDGGIEMFFLSGIFMVIGATILIVQNTDILLRGVSALGGLFKSKLPAVRTAVAYPGASRGRTGLTIAMFSLIIFSLVMMATMSDNFTSLYLGDKANAGLQVRADTTTANPVSDFTGTLQANGVDTSGFAGVGTESIPVNGVQHGRLAGASAWKTVDLVGLDNGFFSTASLTFDQRAVGYDTDAAILQALQSGQKVAIVSQDLLSGGGDFGSSSDALKLTGLKAGDKTFQPITVEIADPATGQARPVQIIGVIDNKISMLIGMFTNDATLKTLLPTTETATSYFVKLADPDRADAVAKSIERALFTNGVQATSIEDQLKESQRQSKGFFYIIQGFMGLGLIVGIAAIGVIAFRSVVERRQQIGVLRAIGFQQGLVALSFMIETLFVVGIGSLAGTGLGLMLARNLLTSDTETQGQSFLIPYALIAVILIGTVAVSLFMTWIPSKQAARVSPAEALRYE